MGVPLERGQAVKELRHKENMIKLIHILFIFLPLWSVFSQEEIDPKYKKMIEKHYDGFPLIQPEDAVKIVNDDSVVFLDTREKDEYNVSHIPGAMFVGYDDFDWDKVENLDRSKTVIVYCSIGVRSQNIGKELKEKGFTDVKNLYGGIFLWADQDRDMHNERGVDTDAVHGYSRLWGRWVQNAEVKYD